MRRRDVLRGALGLGIVGTGVSGFASCSLVRGSGSDVVQGSFRSTALGGVDTGWAVLYPPGASSQARLPVVIALHGKGGNHRDVMDMVDLGALSDSGTLATPIAIASVDCGGSYFHQRADGTDAGAMVTDELLPMLGERGLDTGRLALIGWSMGGYGALLLAATTLRGRVRAVTTMSAALWERPGQSALGAFDSAEDWREHDVFALRPVLAAIPLRVDCGQSDPFVSANKAFVNGFATPPQSSFGPDSHTDAYWRAVAPEQLAFTSRRLAA